MPSQFFLSASLFSSHYKQKDFFTLLDWNNFLNDFDRLFGYPSFAHEIATIDVIQKAMTYQPSYRFAKFLAMRYFYTFPYSVQPYPYWICQQSAFPDTKSLDISPTAVHASVVLDTAEENVISSSAGIKKSLDKLMPYSVALYWKEIEASLVCSHVDSLAKAWCENSLSVDWSRFSSVLRSTYMRLFSDLIPIDSFIGDLLNQQTNHSSHPSRFMIDLFILCVLTHQFPEKSAAQVILEKSICDAEEIFSINGDLFLNAPFEDVFYFLLKVHASQGVLELQVEIERAAALLYNLAHQKIVSGDSDLQPFKDFIKNQWIFESALSFEDRRKMEGDAIDSEELAFIEEEISLLESKMTWIHYGFNLKSYTNSVEYLLSKAFALNGSQLMQFFKDCYSHSLSHQALLGNVLYKKRRSLSKDMGFENFFHYISFHEMHWSAFGKNVLLNGINDLFLGSIHEQLLEMQPLLLHQLPKPQQALILPVTSGWHQFFYYMNSGTFLRFHGVFLTDDLLAKELRKGRNPFKNLELKTLFSLPLIRHLIADFYDQSVLTIFSMKKDSFQLHDLLSCLIDREGIYFLYNQKGHLLDQCFPNWRSDIAAISTGLWWNEYKKMASHRRQEWVEFFFVVKLKKNWQVFHDALLHTAVDNEKSFYEAFLSHGDIDVFCWCIKNNPDPNIVRDLSDRIENLLLHFFSYKKSTLYLNNSDLSDSLDSDYFSLNQLLMQYMSTHNQSVTVDAIISKNRTWILNKARKNHAMCEWLGMLLPDQKASDLYLLLRDQVDYESCDLLFDFYEGKCKVFSTLVDQYTALHHDASGRSKNILNMFILFCQYGLFKKDYISFFGENGLSPLLVMLRSMSKADQDICLSQLSESEQVWNIPDFSHYVYFGALLSFLQTVSNKEQWLKIAISRYANPYQSLVNKLFLILDCMNKPDIMSHVINTWSAFFQQNRYSHFGQYTLFTRSQHAFSFYQILGLIGLESTAWPENFWIQPAEHTQKEFIETTLLHPFFMSNYMINKNALHVVLKSLGVRFFENKTPIEIMSVLIKAIKDQADHMFLWDVLEIILKILESREEAVSRCSPASTKLGFVRNLFKIRNEVGDCVHDFYSHNQDFCEKDLLSLSQNRFRFLALLTQVHETLKNASHLMFLLLKDSKTSEQDVIWLFKAQPEYFLDARYYDMSLWQVAIDKNYHQLWQILIEQEYRRWSRQKVQGIFFQSRINISIESREKEFYSHLRSIWGEKGSEKISVIRKLKQSSHPFFKNVLISYDIRDHVEPKRFRAIL